MRRCQDVDGAPVLIGEIEIDVYGMLGDTDVDRAFRSIELRPCFEQIKRRADRRRADQLHRYF
jgi:hypothetical protein